VRTGRPPLAPLTLFKMSLLQYFYGLSTAVGAETSRPFAVVNIGGLITVTLVTLLILPQLYPWFEPAKPPHK
jgi:cobalt-zinc-cadmium resistance protein CzcA